MMDRFPTPLSLAQLPTPIDFLEAPSERLGVKIFVKRDDLTGGITSGNKIRKLEYSLAKAKEENADVIISCGATQTNHGRALAALCRELRLNCHLFLLGDEQDAHVGNHLLMRILGAKITYVDLPGFMKRDTLMKEAALEWQKKGHTPFLVPVGASDAVGTLGYIMAVKEIAEQMETREMEFDHVVVTVGSGGTMTGLFVGAHLFKQSWQLHGVTVCDDAAYFKRVAAGIIDDLRSEYLPGLSVDSKDMQFVDGFKGKGYGQSDSPLRRHLIALARECGLVLDPVYTMKAWRGLEHLIETKTIRQGQRVLFLHTGGTSGLLGHGARFGANDFET